MPALGPVYGIGSREQHAWRRALPPLDVKCSSVWCSFPAAMAKARWCLRLEASLPALTSGGRAMNPNQGRALQHRRRLWSLPPHALCMPECCGRVRSTCRLDGLHFRMHRFLRLRLCRKIPLEAEEQQLQMDSTCMRILGALSARLWRDRLWR